MNIFLSIQLVFSLLVAGDFALSNVNKSVYTAQKPPPYAKWGRIAMEKTKEKYPQADIIDYLHIGRVKGTDYSIERFKLWLKAGHREFGVYVDITFNNKTEQIIDVKYRETTK